MNSLSKPRTYKLLPILFAFTLITQPFLSAQAQAVQSTPTTEFQAIAAGIQQGGQQDSLIIYQDAARDFILFYQDGQLQSYHSGQRKAITSDYQGNIMAHDMVLGDSFGYVQVSPDGNQIVFYDHHESTFLYDISRGVINTIPLPLAQVVWNAAGNDYEFAMSQSILREGMTTAYSIQQGLYEKQTDGSLKQIFDNSKIVRFLSRKPDGAHFTVRSNKGYLPPLNPDWEEEFVYQSMSGSIKFVPHIPEGAKVILHKNLSELAALTENNTIFPEQRMYFSGSYILAPAGNQYLRYNTANKQKQLVPRPLGIYKGYIYYIKTPFTTGPLYKMNIKTLAAGKNPIAYASSYGCFLAKNTLYFLNPQKDSTGQYSDIPYALNLDSGKLVKNISAPKEPNEYHIFTLQNGNRIGVYFANSRTPKVHLENAQGKVLLQQFLIYSGGYFYQTGKSKDGFPVINQLDTNGKTVKTVFKAFNKYVQYDSIGVSGNYLYFTVGTNNLYKCNLKTGRYQKY